ncbi:MAG: class I SAM-dependent methyltransferase [Sulfitobacter sp.]|nr:class I SAM-dependent methyltransferase [Sulfitobacter sp.]
MYNFLQGREYWDKAAPNPYSTIRSGWSKDDFDERTDETLVTMFPIEFDRTHLFLDLGCGIGYACKMVAPHVAAYFGVDWSEQIIAVARERNAKFLNAIFCRNDGTRLPFPDQIFDHVITEQMFYHVERDVIVGYLREIKRVLAPGGVATIEVPKVEHYINGLKWRDVLGVFPDAKKLGESVVYYARAHG